MPRTRIDIGLSAAERALLDDETVAWLEAWFAAEAGKPSDLNPEYSKGFGPLVLLVARDDKDARQLGFPFRSVQKALMERIAANCATMGIECTLTEDERQGPLVIFGHRHMCGTYWDEVLSSSGRK